jgi:hypothetical protein
MQTASHAEMQLQDLPVKTALCTFYVEACAKVRVLEPIIRVVNLIASVTWLIRRYKGCLKSNATERMARKLAKLWPRP